MIPQNTQDIHMKSQSKRYVFITFENLQKIKFKKLEKVCSKIYILIDVKEKSVPLELVLQTQNLGKNVKWIPTNERSEEDLTYHITFLMGKLHQKVDSTIEFAILSDDSTLDPIVDFINGEGRTCIRVKSKRKEEIPVFEEDIEEEEIFDDMEEEDVEKSTMDYESSLEFEEEDLSDDFLEFEEEESDDLYTIQKSDTVAVAARDTVKRLIRSGNRPSDVSLLKSYILLHNQDLSIQGSIDKVIHRLEETKEIDIDNQEIIYNF